MQCFVLTHLNAIHGRKTQQYKEDGFLLSEFNVLRGTIGDYWSLGCTYVYESTV